MTPSQLTSKAVALRYFAFLLALLGSTLTSHTQAQDLRANVRNPNRNGRSNAPLILRVDLEYTGKILLQGKLELELHNFDRIATLTTSPIALTGGDKSVDVTVPGITVFDRASTVEVRLKFVSATQSDIELGKFAVNVPSTQTRSQVIAVCDPWVNTSGRQWPELVQSLLLESFQPAKADRQKEFDVIVSTFPATLTPTQMPRQSLGYLSYDMVVLMADGLAQMESSQLNALAAWIRAGGSACIIADKDLEEYHLGFLNEVVAIDGGLFEWTPDRNVTYSPLSALGESNLITARVEFGRVAVILNAKNRDDLLASKAWRDARMFLWRLKDSQRKHIQKLGKWFAKRPFGSMSSGHIVDRPIDRATAEAFADEDLSYLESGYYQDDSDTTPGELVATMMPRSVRLIPFGLIIAVLGLFALLIGPGDYVLLGRLKKRKLTWILFPSLAIFFTWVTVALADHYMGQNTSGGEIVIRDLDRDGHLIRETRFVLHFPHENTIHNKTYRNAWHQRVDIDSARPWTVDEYDGGNDNTPPRIEGRLPVHYTVHQQQHKWDPMLSRITTIHHMGDKEPAMSLNWRALEAWNWDDAKTKSQQQSGDILATFRKLLAPDQTFQGQLAVLSRTKDVADSAINAYFERHDGYELYADNRYLESETTTGPSLLPSFITRLSRGQPHNLFAVVNQISPTGGQSIRDLCVLDPDRADEWMLLIFQQEAGDTVIYRKLYAPQQ